MTNQAPTISALARQAGVSVETIRYYQRRGLLPQPSMPTSGARHYGEPDIARIRFIKSAQRLGFTLEEIGLLQRLEDGTNCGEAREIAERKLVAARHKIVNLQSMEAALARLVGECATSRERICCPLIDALQRTTDSPRLIDPGCKQRAGKRQNLLSCVA